MVLQQDYSHYFQSPVLHSSKALAAVVTVCIVYMIRMCAPANKTENLWGIFNYPACLAGESTGIRIHKSLPDRSGLVS